MAYFFPGETISRIHGQQRKRDNLLVIPMYHPAAALHQERFRRVIEDDFRKLRAVLDEANRPPVEEKPVEEQPHQMRLL
jgi:DNA polymerase